MLISVIRINKSLRHACNTPWPFTCEDAWVGLQRDCCGLVLVVWAHWEVGVLACCLRNDAGNNEKVLLPCLCWVWGDELGGVLSISSSQIS